MLVGGVAVGGVGMENRSTLTRLREQYLLQLRKRVLAVRPNTRFFIPAQGCAHGVRLLELSDFAVLDVSCFKQVLHTMPTNRNAPGDHFFCFINFIDRIRRGRRSGEAPLVMKYETRARTDCAPKRIVRRNE